MVEEIKLSDRLPNGHFKKGHEGGPGNPHCKQVEKFRQIFYKCTTQKSLRLVIKKLYELAVAGDIKAIQEVLNRTLGKPAQHVEIEGGTIDTNLLATQFAEMLRHSIKGPDVK